SGRRRDGGLCRQVRKTIARQFLCIEWLGLGFFLRDLPFACSPFSYAIRCRRTFHSFLSHPFNPLIVRLSRFSLFYNDFRHFTPLSGSGFWLSVAVGRLVSVPLSLHFSPSRLLAVFIATSVVGMLAFLSIGRASVRGLWFCTVLYGFGLAPLHPLGINLPASLHTALSPGATSALIFAGAAGEMVLPLAMGFVLDASAPVVLYVVELAASVVMAAAIAMCVSMAPGAAGYGWRFSRCGRTGGGDDRSVGSAGNRGIGNGGGADEGDGGRDRIGKGKVGRKSHFSAFGRWRARHYSQLAAPDIGPSKELPVGSPFHGHRAPAAAAAATVAAGTRERGSTRVATRDAADDVGDERCGPDEWAASPPHVRRLTERALV
ncbi:unnamed protein product, partial [Phaeothamnion confervicola]